MMETGEISYRDRLLDTGLSEGPHPFPQFKNLDLDSYGSLNIGWLEGPDIDVVREHLVRFDDFQVMQWDEGSVVDFRFGMHTSVSVPFADLGRVAHAFDIAPIEIVDRCAARDGEEFAFLDVPLEGVVYFGNFTFGPYAKADTQSVMGVEKINELIREAYP